jgi:hypothetical protein
LEEKSDSQTGIKCIPPNNMPIKNIECMRLARQRGFAKSRKAWKGNMKANNIAAPPSE